MITKHNDDVQYAWESSTGGPWTVQADHGEPISQSTKVILFLKEHQKKYSGEGESQGSGEDTQFIGYDITFYLEKEEETSGTMR